MDPVAVLNETDVLRRQVRDAALLVIARDREGRDGSGEDDE
jgi:hypothetical protein